jgi:transposase-like protein
MPQPNIPQAPARVPPHMPCPRCHDVMMLSMLQPGTEGECIQTFRCRACGHSKAITAYRS